MTFSETVNKVIELGRKVREYYDIVLPKFYPNYPLVDSVDDVDNERVPPPPEEKELSDFLASLPDEMLYQLNLIIDLHWRKVSANDLAGYYEGMKKMLGDRDEVLAQLMWDKTILADELSDGMEELHKHKIDPDKLLSKKIKIRKR